MASEAVITSVPRGIKLGRTGFQVVMRTAGLSDNALSSLEQLAGYRHVFPQGSGRNPVIYSYRLVRGPACELRVLCRTVDAGNDFSSRSNKLAHLLVIDAGEANVLRDSSPAAVLSAIDGRLIQVWQGGPEERLSTFDLPAVPTQAHACVRWRDVMGDAGWGGLVAQRAMSGQPSLVVAPDCSPLWSRRLLELFQEVLALLPSGSRWKTTFETTVIGTSSAILRGTYAGSPESAAGRQGLLVVDLSHKSPLPETVPDSELILLSREGQSKFRAGAAPALPSRIAPPTVPVDGLEEHLGAGLPEPARPSRAPVSWDNDDEDVPRSRLGSYIGGGMVLLGAILVSALLVGRHFYDDYRTNKLRKKIEDFASITDGNDPGAESTPTIADWERAYREDDTSILRDAAVLQVVLSALASKRVDATYVREEAKRNALLRAAHAVAQAKPDQTALLEHARNLGLTISDALDGPHKKALALFVSSWLASDHPYRKDDPPTSLELLQKRVDAATMFVNAALTPLDDPDRGSALKRAATGVWPELSSDADSGRWEEGFAGDLDPDTMEYATVSGILDKAKKSSRLVPTVMPPSKDASTPINDSLETSRAFENLRKELLHYTPSSPGKDESLVLARKIDVSGLRLSVSLPSDGKWNPTVVPDNPNRPANWELKGTADDPDLVWGRLSLDAQHQQLVFKRLISAESEYRTDVLYIPLRLSSGTASAKLIADVVLADEEKLRFTATGGASLADLMETGSCMLVMDKPSASSALAKCIPQAIIVSLAASEPSGLRLEAGGRVPGGLIVNVLAVVDKQGAAKSPSLSDVLIDAFVVAPIDDNGYLAFAVTRNGSQENLWRDLQELQIALPSQKCSEETWRKLVHQMLKASKYDDLHGPLDKKARRFVEQLISDKLTNEERNRTVNALERGGVHSWFTQTCEFLFTPEGAYHVFTLGKVTEQHGDRPSEIQEPVALPKNPSEAEEHDHMAKVEAWRERQRQLESWDQRVEEMLRSSLNLVGFLRHTAASAAPQTLDPYRAAGVVVLEVAAQETKERTRRAMQQVALPSLFKATITLPWKFDDDVQCPVRRLTIDPAAAIEPADSPTSVRGP